MTQAAFPDGPAMTPMEEAVADCLASMKARNYSPLSVRTYSYSLDQFVAFLADRGVTAPGEVTVEILESYQRHLSHHRTRSGSPLSAPTIASRMQAVHVLFARLFRTRQISVNPVAYLDKPRLERRLPPAPLSIEEVEAVLACPDVETRSACGTGQSWKSSTRQLCDAPN